MTTAQVQLDPDRSDVDLTCSRTGFTLTPFVPTGRWDPDEYPPDSSTSPTWHETIDWLCDHVLWNVHHRVDDTEGIPVTEQLITVHHAVHQPPQNGTLLCYRSTGVEQEMVDRLPATPENGSWYRYQPKSSTAEILIRWVSDPADSRGPIPGPLTPRAESVAHRDIYEARILDLRSMADVDEDIEHVNEESIRDFWSFMNSEKFARRAGLVLQDNGNLRAVWRDGCGHNVGLEFQGGGLVLYVIFKPDERKTIREADIDRFDAVVNKLRELDLLGFVNV